MELLTKPETYYKEFLTEVISKKQFARSGSREMSTTRDTV